jgi:hypothetical protein
VRRGHRTLDAYTEYLAALGYDEAARAGMRELVALQIADDTAARKVRDDAAATLRTRGLSLEQMTRAVTLGLKTVDDFERFLMAQSFTQDAAAVLIGALRLDLAHAEAARAARTTVDARPDAPTLALSTVRRAARLGVVPVPAYQARLEAAGYGADDVAIELDLLLLEIAELQAARRRRQTIDGELAARTLSLGDLEDAVKKGFLTVGQYAGQLQAYGYGADDAALLAALLEASLAAA